MLDYCLNTTRSVVRYYSVCFTCDVYGLRNTTLHTFSWLCVIYIEIPWCVLCGERTATTQENDEWKYAYYPRDRRSSHSISIASTVDNARGRLSKIERLDSRCLQLRDCVDREILGASGVDTGFEWCYTVDTVRGRPAFGGRGARCVALYHICKKPVLKILIVSKPFLSYRFIKSIHNHWR